MPELPEVEAARSLVDKLKGQKIVKAVAADDEIVIEGVSPRDLETALTNKTITDAVRKGKHMWLDFGDGSPSLMLHFGMTGCIAIEGVDAVKYQLANEVDMSSWPPKFWKLDLELDSGKRMAFCDSRRFARVRLQQDPLNNEPVSLLGFDVLTDRPTTEHLAEVLGKRRTAIKSVLLDQKVSAGTGNWLTDEVLHSAGIHPSERACDLNEHQIKALQGALLEVTQTAVDAGADSDKYPAGWLFHGRWAPKKAPAHIAFLKIGGRTTAYDPTKQKLSGKVGADAKQSDGSGDKPKPKAATKTKAPAGKATAGSRKKAKTEDPPDEGGEAAEAAEAPAKPPRRRNQAAAKADPAVAAQESGGEAAAEPAAAAKSPRGRKSAGAAKKAITASDATAGSGAALARKRGKQPSVTAKEGDEATAAANVADAKPAAAKRARKAKQ